MKINKNGYWEETPQSYYGWSPKLANWITSILDKDLPVYDFGCGGGHYSITLSNNGFSPVIGIEGSPMVDKTRPFGILQADLSTPLNWLDKWQKGNAICLEVIEHIPQEYESIALNNISRVCTKRLVFSWAIPGQGTIDINGHINEQNNSHAILAIELMGYKVNSKLSNDGRNNVDDNCPWFRNTLFVFDKI